MAKQPMTAEELAETQRKAGLAMMIVAMLPAFLVVLAFAMEDKTLDKLKLYGAIGTIAIVVTGGLILKGVSAAVWLAAVVTGVAGAAMLIAGLREMEKPGIVLGAALLLGAAPWFGNLALNIRRAKTD